MDRSARKRTSVGSNSPPAHNNGNKRRSPNKDDASIILPAGIAYQAEFGSENINLNRANEWTANTGTARRPLSEINRNTPSTGGKPLSEYDINCTAGVSHISATTTKSGQGLLKEGIEASMKPSQRILKNVKLSGLTYQSPVSRILPGISTPQNLHVNPFQMPALMISLNKANQATNHCLTYKSPISRILQGSSMLRNPQIRFPMPASRISPNNINQPTVHSGVDKRFLESYNHDKGRHMSPSLLYSRESDIKSKTIESGSSIIMYQLFASTGAIKFPTPESEAWKEKIKRLYLLLTVTESIKLIRYKRINSFIKFITNECSLSNFLMQIMYAQVVSLL